MTEHRCGPTDEQIRDAALHGETIGTYERCADCEAREVALLAKIGPFLRPRRQTGTLKRSFGPSTS